LEIRIDNGTSVPIYKQISEQVKQLIANNKLKPGQQLPTVRGLAKILNINPATVARSYQELEQEGILGASRRRGTIVLGDSDNPQRIPLRQTRLTNMVNDLLVDALSQGYSVEELEASITLQLARWRIQRETASQARQKAEIIYPALRIVGSNDLALELLINRFKYENPDVRVSITVSGSLGGLLALQEGNADMAGIHLLDEESGEYNFPYIKHILPKRQVAVVHLADRIQGLMLKKSNPRDIKGLEDLNRDDIVFANRQKGSGTRVWLDYKLRELGIIPYHIKGYLHEYDTHLAVATAIVNGEADMGIGIEAAAKPCNLDFIPLTKEKFDLVIPLENYRSETFKPMLKVIKSRDFKSVVNELGGYDTSSTGKTVIIK